jgi:nicotinamidase-related amidase
MKALLIIDMQKGSFKPYSACHDAYGTIDRINTIAQQCRSKNIPVIYIQHDGSKENCFYPGTEDWELLPELDKSPTDRVISKTANDSFYRTELESILNEMNIIELLITGSATDFCVDATIKAALSKDYKITVIADGHTATARPYIDAESLINHYNWLWGDLSPTKYKMSVIKTEYLQL